ncbi:UNVERIFIED_CONTAM: hypothetical protein PYX00_005799 [Menopon gallinae]|uniref:RNA helicase n=1 Tax=Menopon gallinae TaxID=328185 RepID=A0AAW2HU90_9NEOP
MKKFADLNLSPWIVRQCDSYGLTEPTPIQVNCIPPILNGEDCIGCAKTGSGKTLAFALPILEKLSHDPYGIFALVLTPTRELAYQIGDQFLAYGKVINLKLTIVVGGMDMVTQAHDLSKRPHIVIATPGRLADHLDSCDTFSLSRIKFLVMDEADRLLGGQFDVDIQRIFKALPSKKQILMFSATLTDSLQQVQKVASNKVYVYVAPAETATVEQLQQFYVLCPGHVKDAYLVELVRKYLEANEDGNIIIFTDTCKNCQLLSMTLNEIGYENVALHAMNRQRERLASLAKFRSNIIKVLIATDVASRGLDIPTVELVINHSIPNIPKDYIHRVGRTARAGRPGKSISLVAPQDIRLIHAIEELINTKLKEYTVDDKEVIKILTQVKVTKREAEIKLNETDFFERRYINERKRLIMEGKDPDEVAEIMKNRKRQRYKKGLSQSEKFTKKKKKKAE